MKFLSTFIFVAVLLINFAFAENVPTGMFAPLPTVDPALATSAKVVLGKKLFLDTNLSLDKDLSCNSCHNLKTFGVDNQSTSTGHKKQLGGRNSPTVYNASLHFAQFWDGRAKDVEEQALGPVRNPVEMAMPDEATVESRLRVSAEYKKLFSEAFPGEAQPITFANMGKAIGAFERTLLTPSRFDKYLQGDTAALSAHEVEGLKTFVRSGCTACHMGPAIGGQMYQKLGLVKPFPTKDLGRFEVTKQEADKFMFKVPSLRNIEKTAPYFHDGSVKTLEEAVSLMGEHQLGRVLSKDDVGKIVSFLKALTGEIPKIAVAQ